MFDNGCRCVCVAKADHHLYFENKSHLTSERLANVLRNFFFASFLCFAPSALSFFADLFRLQINRSGAQK